MRYEFIEFYPRDEKSKMHPKCLGTVHVYLPDVGVDLRGIRVYRNGKQVFFNFPHYRAYDRDQKRIVSYPHFRFTDEKVYQELMQWMVKEVKPKVVAMTDRRRAA